MNQQMKAEMEQRLSDMTVAQLKDIARKHSIDISGVTRKKEIVDKILESEKAQEITGVKEKDADKTKAVDKKMLKSEELEKDESGQIPKVTRKLKTQDKIAEVRQYVRFMMGNRPSFFEIDGMVEQALVKYGTGDHAGAIRAIQAARERASDLYSHFRIFTNAIGIDASEKVLSEAVSRKGLSQDEANKLIETAMMGFVDGSPKIREETLRKLEEGALGALDRILGDLAKDLEMAKRRLQEMKDIGADVVEAGKLINDAEQNKIGLKIPEAKALLEQSIQLIKKAEKIRLEEIRYSIPRVRAAIDEAKSMGIEVVAPEKDLKKASYYLERGEIKMCVESLSKSEIAVDELHRAKLSSDPALRKSQLDKAHIRVQQTEPVLNDISTYGIDASEGMHYLRNTQTAISRNDPMNAAKFARRMDQVSLKLSEELEKMKKRSKHLSGERCQKCDQEMLYSYDTGVVRCSNCGNWTRLEK